MKKLISTFGLLLLTSFVTTLYGQNFYEQQWKILTEQAQKGNFKSNQPIILNIQKQAMKDKNLPELIRSLKAEFSIMRRTLDDTQNDTASQFFKKIQEAGSLFSGEEALVFQVLKAEFIRDYYDSVQWRIRSRTNTDNQDVSQVETWTNLGFKNYLSKEYQNIFKQKELLKSISLKSYQSIFNSKFDLEYYPTMLDWASGQYINFLSNSTLFTKNELETNEATILKLYDDVIATNSGNANLYFKAQKLDYQIGRNPNDKSLKEKWQTLYNDSTEGDYKVMIASRIAENLISNQKESEALEVIKKAKSAYPKSGFLGNIQNQENQILLPNASFYLESTTLANKPIQLLVEAKNVKKAQLEIYQVKEDIKGFLGYLSRFNDSNKYQSIKKVLVRTESFDFPTKNDYKSHKTAFEIKALPAGIYLTEYLVDGKPMSYQRDNYFLVSAAKSIFKNVINDNNTDWEYFWINSENGKLIKNPNLKVHEFPFESQSPSVQPIIVSKDSSFKMPVSDKKAYYRFSVIEDVNTGDVELKHTYGSTNDYYNNRNIDKEHRAQIFLDRAIYRPGQVVYFKVINTKLENNKETTMSGIKQKIILEDVNSNEVGAQTFVTNEFGSYSGSFTLPKSKLNGQFRLSINDSNLELYSGKAFSVEEYKRPNFELNFDPIKDEYKYGQKIELKGKAIMFSGVPLSNATINYEIKKQNIRWRYFSWYPQIFDNENSILGETKTNDKGEFTIVLDLKKNEKLEGIQIDEFNINASATDISGETQSANTRLTVSSVSHYITATNLKDQFSDDEIKVNVETKNYNNQNLKKSYHTKLSKLEEPQRIFRNQFKNQIQDLPQLSKSEFEKLFPHDRFDKTELPKNWKTEQVLFDKTTQDSLLNIGKLSPGFYRLEFYNIEGKDSIKTSQDFQVWSKTNLDPKQKTFLNTSFDKKEYQVGETANLLIYSAIPNAIANIYIQNGDGKTLYESKSLSSGFLKYPVKINQKSEVLNVQVVLAAFNDVQTENLYVPIKRKDDGLKIETTTFRDKLQPNSKEKWSFKIVGAPNEKVLAEVLANMYDMSLDKFAANGYSFNNIYYRSDIINDYNLNTSLSSAYFSDRLKNIESKFVKKPEFDWKYFNLIFTDIDGDGLSDADDACPTVYGLREYNGCPKPAMAYALEATGAVRGSNMRSKMAIPAAAPISKEERLMEDKNSFNQNEDLEKIKIRENLNETAFFYPNLVTDEMGNISFEFTTPEALTKWKLMLLAHTKDAKSAYAEKTMITQKDFSVTPNYPRFLREGDEINFQSKLNNLTSKQLNGVAQIKILDAFTNEDITQKFGLSQLTATKGYNFEQSFLLNGNSSDALTWTLKIPKDVSSIILKVVAKAGEFSDGEQKAIAILPNRMLVTDAVPVFVKEGETKTFQIDNLLNNNSSTVSNVRHTLELTTNPIWEVMFALPSLKNETKNSADVIFNKWFADVIASEVFKANPRLKTIFDEYQAKGLLTSNLEKNQELKQLLLDETPWMLDSKNEEEQMSKLVRLFDVNTMRNSIQQDWESLLQLQNPDGGFSWYPGYPSSYYSSLYILKNLGKLNLWLKDNVKEYQSDSQKQMLTKLITFVDNNINKYWDVRKENPWSNASLEYLDARHYWEKDYPLTANPKTLKNLVIKKAKTAKIDEFTFFGLHRAALLFDQYELKDVSTKLMTYLKETSTESKTQGIYWKQNLDDWGWYASKVVNHAGALEAFNTLKPNDQQFIEDLKIWLITQKEVNSWGTSRSTAEVIFTILNSGKSWTTPESDKATIIWGSKDMKLADQKATGYIKMSDTADKLDKSLGKVTVTKPGPGIVQGGLFWQYYEDLDKIKSSENYISINKEYFKKVKTENGEQLIPINEKTILKVGDKITVRMILNADRNMEYVHLKDMRAAGTEPLDVISAYQWKNNLGYYQSTKDASTNFYIEYMPKGKYVFEYDLVANASGIFSTGISTLQNYYAPQMNSHTAGSKMEIK